MNKYKYIKFRKDLNEISNELNNIILNHNFIKNKKCSINIHDYEHEIIVSKLLRKYGLSLVKKSYNHPEYLYRHIDYYIVMR